MKVPLSTFVSSLCLLDVEEMSTREECIKVLFEKQNTKKPDCVSRRNPLEAVQAHMERTYV